MLYPIEINMEIIDEQGNPNIVAIVLDYHYSKVVRILHTLDGYTTILTTQGDYIKILRPYREMVDLYHLQHKIDNRYKEEVEEYFKDNYKAIKLNKAGNGKTN